MNAWIRTALARGLSGRAVEPRGTTAPLIALTEEDVQGLREIGERYKIGSSEDVVQKFIAGSREPRPQALADTPPAPARATPPPAAARAARPSSPSPRTGCPLPSRPSCAGAARGPSTPGTHEGNPRYRIVDIVGEDDSDVQATFVVAPLQTSPRT
jgi:hypothetical protein